MPTPWMPMLDAFDIAAGRVAARLDQLIEEAQIASRCGIDTAAGPRVDEILAEHPEMSRKQAFKQAVLELRGKILDQP